jgi:protoporphyrinogen IX oxidase
MDINTIKALHIIFVVSWFAGLFYIVRLFIYHTEAQERDEVAKEILSIQYQLMESRLWWIITTPAMVLTVIFGGWLIWDTPNFLNQGWMQLKLTFVAVLFIYHFTCQKIMKDLKKGLFKWSSNALRIWNELATLVLVAIIFLVETGPAGGMSWLQGTLGFFGVAICLLIAIKLYKRFR